MKDKKHIGERSRAKGFMSGVLLLSLSTLLVKIIGLAFKIPMLSFLGTEGMGYFNSAYEIYALLCVISTAGLPIALSMTVSAARTRGDGKEIKRIYRVARNIFLIFGLCGTVLMLVFSRQIADFIGNPDSYMCILAIAPALLCICLASAVRGYCQGFENMTPTAISQLIEAVSKLGFGILFAIVAIKNEFPVFVVAAFAVFGVTLGTFLSVCYLAIEKRRVRAKSESIAGGSTRDSSKILKELVSIALPITLGSALLGITRIIDMTLIMRRLQDIGVSVLEANSIYGAYTTLAVPVFSLVPALITPVSMAMVPQLSSFIESKNNEGQRSIIEKAMRITVLLGMPASLGLAAFSRPILELLFVDQPQAIDVSAPLLAILGASVVFSCLITTTNAILQSYRRAYIPIISMLVGVAVKFAVSYLLIGDVRIGALGAPIGSLLCNITVTLLNLYFMGTYENCAFSAIKVFFKPAIASFICVGTAFAVYVWLVKNIQNRYLPLALAIALAVLVYFAFSLVIKSITAEDVILLPFGEKLAGVIFKNKKNNVQNDGGKNDCQRKENDASGKGGLHGRRSGNGN